MALVVFTGGTRSGKSSAAQELARIRELDGSHVTVAVFGRENVDAEFVERVAAHRSVRPVGFVTVEALHSRQWTSDVPAQDLLLVDCLGTWMGLAMEEAFAACAPVDLGAADADVLPAGFAHEFAARTEPVLSWLLQRAGDTIVVTNEVGCGVVPAWATGRFFRDELARANRRLVASADAACLSVCGRLLSLDSLPSVARWPED